MVLGVMVKMFIRKMAIITILILISTALYPAVIENRGYAANQDDMEEMKAVIKGAVEDDSWLYASDAAHIHNILGKYYKGELLENLTRDAWEFKSKNTDWYSSARLVSIAPKQLYNGGATVLAVIDVEDCTTGGRQTGSAVYDITYNVDEGWRIVNVIYKWNADV
jgi:hypothetical protein